MYVCSLCVCVCLCSIVSHLYSVFVLEERIVSLWWFVYTFVSVSVLTKCLFLNPTVCACMHIHVSLSISACLCQHVSMLFLYTDSELVLLIFLNIYSHKHVQYGIWDSDKCPYSVNKNIHVCVLHNSKDSIQCPFILKSLLYLKTSWS